MNRTTRRVSLTPEGESYLLEGSRIWEELQTLEVRIGGGAKQPQGTLKVSATLGFGRTYLTPALAKFSEVHPEVDVQMHLTDKPINLVDQGFDVQIRFGELDDSRLTARLLANNRRLLLASPEYLLRSGTPACPRDLGQHSCIFIREGDETFGTWHLRRAEEHESVKVRGNLSTNDGTAALAWALDGRGILLRSQWDVARHVRAGQLVPILQDWALPSADIYAVFQSANQMPAKIRTVVDLLAEEFAPYRRRGDGVLGSW